MRVLACALGALAIGCSGAARSPCEQQAKAEQWRAAYAACVLEYPASHSVDVAFRVGNAALRIGRYDEGVTFVTPLLTGARAADAHGLLGSLELQRENLQQARVHARIASTLHQFMGNDAGRARDEHQLAGAQFKLGEYALALENGDQARAAAVRAHDDRMQVFVDIAQADILRELGDLKRAEIVARRAHGAAVAPADRVLADLKLAIVLLEGDGWGLSGPFLFDALGLQLTLQNGSDLLLQSLYLNIALYERLSGNYPAALVAVEDARRARPDDLLSYRLNRGLVLSDMGRHSEAIADLADAETRSLSGEWSWWVPFQRAIAEERAGRSFEHAMGDGKPTAARSWWEVLQGAAAAAHLEDAIRADGRATERVAELAAKSGRFGPTVIASHRGPHLHLIGVLASQQRWPDVLEVVATMDAQSLLDSQEASGRSPVGSVAAMAASPRPHFEVASGPRAPSILEAWRGRRLLIIVPGGEHVWRLELVDGTLSATAVGEPAALGKLASTLEKDPGDAAVARALGERMLSGEPASGGRLELLVIGPLAHAPLAALRFEDALAVTRWQLVRASGVLPRSPPGDRGPDRPGIAIGDPQGDLPEAAREARRVAARFAGQSFIGPQATRANLALASGAKVLHIAAHTTQQIDGSILRLAGGEQATVSDIARLEPPPRLVVLATCAGSKGRDDAGHGSFALAFIDAGADAVVATRWSVADVGSAELVDAFYQAGGDVDPVRALASAQASLADRLPPRVWAAFEVITARPIRR